jgi:hypothetical protein
VRFLMRRSAAEEGRLRDEGEISTWLDRGKAAVVVIIPPPGFGRRRSSAGRPVLTDGAPAMPATVSIAYLAAIVRARYRPVCLRDVGRVDRVRASWASWITMALASA